MAKTTATPALMTTGMIARDLGTNRDRVEDVIQREAIQPTAFASHFRLFDNAAVTRIRTVLAARDARRANRSRQRTAVA